MMRKELTRGVVNLLAFFGLYLINPGTIQGAFEPRISDANTLAAGNIRSILNPFSNPALLCSENATRIGLGGTLYLAGMGIWSSNLGVQTNIKGVPLSVSGNFFGDDIYGEYNFNLGSSRQLFSFLSVGISLDGRYLSIQNYGNYRGAGLTLGTLLKLSPALELGILWQNILQKPLVKSEPEPELFSIGLKYSADLLAFVVGLEKDAQLPLNIQFGTFSTWSDWWGIAVGYESAANSFAVGANLRWSSWEVGYAWQWRAHLPPLRTFSLYYSF